MSYVKALPPPPPWLAPLQATFAQQLQSPLDPSGGSLHSRDQSSVLLAALAASPTRTAGLRLYHEQYWMRLYTAMQGEFPRFAQVVGYWNFNQLATVHLREAPPKVADLARCADGFAARLLGLISDKNGGEVVFPNIPAPLDLARQALQMDEAVRHSFLCRYQHPWRPSTAELASLEARKLRFAPSFRLLREDWAIAERGLLPQGPPAPFPPHPSSWYWVSFRTDKTTALQRIEAPFARFLKEAARAPFGEALATTERAGGPEQAEKLRAALPGWIQHALQSSWWIGLQPA